MAGRYRSSGTPFLTFGVRNSPASTILALGSPLLMPPLNTRRRATYCLALGFRYQKLGELTSFQSCQSVMGSLGTAGLSDQKLPFAPYLAAAACANARKSSMCGFEGG